MLVGNQLVLTTGLETVAAATVATLSATTHSEFTELKALNDDLEKVQATQQQKVATILAKLVTLLHSN